MTCSPCSKVARISSKKLSTKDLASPLITLETVVQQALQREYGDHEGPLDLVVISDGAGTIRSSLQAIFGTAPVVILDWVPLAQEVSRADEYDRASTRPIRNVTYR